jgi:hypothetical protein
VLGLKLGRRKSSRRQPPKQTFLPDVIDISAARADAELEERNRLRDMAAQAIGLQPYTDAQASSNDCSIANEDGYQDVTPLDSADVCNAAHQSGIPPAPNAQSRSFRGSSSSLSVAHPQPIPTSRVRSGSTVTHTAATTTSFAPIPPYPSTVSSLSPFRQCEGLYPKYYPHSSLRIFALSKNWKYRYLMMSSPATFVARGQSPAVSYLHVFKSAGLEEKELERLEINEDSVVFVAEDDVGGKQSVIKVGGTDVGAMKKEYMINEGGYSMWLLHIENTADAQRWITNVKNAVLGQRYVLAFGCFELFEIDLHKRTVRAGLIPAYPLGAHEPRGDMDVMLSIRTQGIVTSNTVVTKPGTAAANVSVPENSSFSSRSVHSLKAAAAPTSLSALKGLFIARPRSASRPASIYAERDQEKESLHTLGNNPPMLRSSTPDSPSVATVQSISAAQTNITYSLPEEPIDRYLHRKILTPPHSSLWKGSLSTNRETAAHKSDIILPLQPPPRKRWTASGLSTNDSHAFSYSGRPNSLQVSKMFMGMSESETSSPSQIDISYFDTPEHRPRASSLQSVSTFASGDHRISMERSSTSTKRSSSRRWSKQSLLPSPMSPPSDPPPPVPVHQANTPPTFSKRTSGESSRSTNSSGISMRVRGSVPPPRPAPTSALPPAPTYSDQDELNHGILKPLEIISSASKPPFRSSSVHRSSRLSLMAPKPPPNTSLPARPDDQDCKTSRRRSSSEIGYPTTLESIPGSPLPSTAHDDADLPPAQLPPAPILPLPVPPVDQIPSTNRVASLKQRLRILSTSGGVPAIGRSRLSTDRSSIDSSSSPIQRTSFSPPSTPIGEKIIPIQDDSFLQLYTPIMSTAPFIPGKLSSQDQQDSEPVALTSLSPPPRRGPKQTLESDCICPKNPIFLPPGEQLDTIEEKKHLLASPPLSPNSRLLPEVATDEWMSADDSSGTDTKLTSSEHDVSTSRPSSIISQGLMSI